MESCLKRKLKRNMFLKAWERCKSLGFGRNIRSARNISDSSTKTIRPSSLSSPSLEDDITKKPNKNKKVAPAGCFTVYVGEKKQRFVIKTEMANYPLFKQLLNDAESIYGFNGQGPLLLPCDVDLFYKVLAEMESIEEISSSSLSTILCRPAFYSINKKKHGAYYRLLSPSYNMLKLNPTTVF